MRETSRNRREHVDGCQMGGDCGEGVWGDTQ